MVVVMVPVVVVIVTCCIGINGSIGSVVGGGDSGDGSVLHWWCK